MTPLPQRKKSPEEIAKLRESLGVPEFPAETNPPGSPPVPPAPAPPAPPAAPEHTARQELPPAPSPHPGLRKNPAPLPSPNPDPSPSPDPAQPAPAPEQPIPTLSAGPTEPVVTLEIDDPAPVHIDPPGPEPTAGPKPVRSLKKSEQGPIESHEPPPDSNLPIHRHSDRELQDIRRRQAIALQTQHPPHDPRLVKAHPALVIASYLLALTPAPLIYFLNPATAIGLALPILSAPVATFIGIRTPLSRHHAAFISIIAIFSLTFAILHYFPHLRHAA